MIFPGEKRRAGRMTARPMGPAPTTEIVSPGETLQLSTLTSKEVGRMSERNRTCSSLNPSGML